MNGLGIVLEETELRTQGLVADLQPNMPSEGVVYEETEALLPPLPDENPASLAAISPLHPVTGSPSVLQKSLVSPDDAPELISPQRSHVVLSELFAQPLDLLLDPQALNDTPLADPYALPPAAPQLSLPPPSPTQSSPLKRLRNGIRKISLSMTHAPQLLLASSLSLSASNLISNGASLAASAQLAASTMLGPHDHPVLRPLLTPLQTDTSLLEGGASSIESATSGTLSSQTMSSSILPSKFSSTNTTPQEQLSSYPNSSSQTPISTKSRHRQLSMSNSASHSLPQPVIMLSDNLSASGDLLAVEQSFFDSLGNESSTQPLSIDKLETSENLIEYLIFLNKHKQSVETAYEVTKQCLTNSGWCSSHDLENLSLQRDVALSQIDTKFLQIEEQLNSRFQMSMFNNSGKVPNSTPSIPEGPKESSLSPSLKVLESRCLSFALPQA